MLHHSSVKQGLTSAWCLRSLPVWIVTAVLTMFSLVPVEVAWGQADPAPPCILDPSLDPQDIPKVRCIAPSEPGSEPSDLTAFDTIAWQTFKMLIWPAAMQGTRGTPDTNQRTFPNDVPLVFETYKSDWETFQPGAIPPGDYDWAAMTKAKNPCGNNPQVKAGDLVLASFNRFDNLRQASGDKALLGNTLIAQNGTAVRYLIGYNQDTYGVIIKNHLYDPGKLPNFTLPPTSPVPAAMQAPEPSNPPNPRDGAITVKSAWVVMTADLDASRFHTRDAWLMDPKTGVCAPTKVGLVGLHIVHKLSGFKQWVWASFEQIDNVPDSTATSRRFTFNNGSPSARMPTSLGAAYYQIPNASSVPFNVERALKIDSHAVTINRDWQKKFAGANSVWQFYQLVMTQWPEENDTKGSGDLCVMQPNPPVVASFNSTLSNTVIETMLQDNAGGCDPKDIGHTCMGCHVRARATDFVWSPWVNKISSQTDLKQHTAGKSPLPGMLSTPVR